MARTCARVVITGATGFVGSRLVQRFLAEGSQVRAVGHLRPGLLPAADQPTQRLEHRALDICDFDQVAEAVSNHDIVIHTVGVTQGDVERVNVKGTQTVIDACRRAGVPVMLHVSSTAALGIPVDRRVHQVPLPYPRSKRAAEQLVRDAHGPDLATVIVNPGVIFGPDRDGYRGRATIDRVLDSKIVFCTHGGLSIAHVDDVADGIVRTARDGRPGEAYVLSGENVSFRDIASTVCSVAEVRRRVISIPASVQRVASILLNLRESARASGRYLYLDTRYAHPWYSSARAEQELGYEARPFRDIVSEYLALRRQAPSRASTAPTP